jgi:ABC-type cobalamin/Fe3+-siderophores transport system ATPase subunit
MIFQLPVPKSHDPNFAIQLPAGEVLFVLGPNGVGKSRLIQQFFARNNNQAVRISAHRQNWFSGNAVSLTPEQRINALHHFISYDSSIESVWNDNISGTRSQTLIYDLVSASNNRNRKITDAIDAGQLGIATKLSKEVESPIKVINELLRLSNLPIVISITDQGEILATKSGSLPYGIHQLSDGERNALIIIASVLTAQQGTLILIDEPERHLHHSISSPLLSLLIAKRPDCAFVVSTHDIMLPLDDKKANTLLIRSCVFNGIVVESWDADILSSSADIDEQTKEDILGSRRKMLFIEGTLQSLDTPLYSLVFPNVSIVAKESCRDVEKFVTAIRQEESVHWVRAFGIIDSDGRSQTDKEQLKTQGIYALPFYSVEAIYYHPEMQRRIAERQAALIGGEATKYVADAQTAALKAIHDKVQHFSQRIAEKAIREEVFKNLPKKATMQSGIPIAINIDVAAAIKDEETRLKGFLASNDFLSILIRYPIRESGALGSIAKSLQFTSRSNYEKAVIKLLIDDQGALNFVKSLFGDLPADIQQ